MIREFFYLQKSDRQVILALLVVIAVALGVIFFTGGRQEQTNALTPADSVDSMITRYPRRDTARRQRRPYGRTKIVYRDRAVSRDSRNRLERQTKEPRDSFVPRYPVKIHEGEYVALDLADTTSLMTVPGIGPYYARQIIRYGERLGGYVSVDQLDEIDDFPTESKRYFKVEASSPRKLNINRLSLSELKRHPYINFYQAKAITDYRRLHGPLKSLNELRLSKDFPQEAIDRLSPYVAY